ncbi:hypothetical protein I2485_14365 [Nesterenkonia sp. E16_7]|uniref:hypothetical protein n=1 Tax=unclassified Nesterenkonia TaxID=2629769 RepID=UPI001A911CCE|nr:MULTISPECIES: hypothetical protein [unclassified Nesterenkonia]MBO0594894.1 hypothetical protein [Nesterenkonia sp. E16_10]MBO0599830.1 hypothetical protein [Nesterenkonia sp. E16_7]
MSEFANGAAVSVIQGPMKGLYGTVVFHDETEHKYLVRFTGSQQMFYDPDQIVLWR